MINIGDVIITTSYYNYQHNYRNYVSRILYTVYINIDKDIIGFISLTTTDNSYTMFGKFDSASYKFVHERIKSGKYKLIK